MSKLSSGTHRFDDRRLRRLRQLTVLLLPYKGRIALMFIALAVATAAALAPPMLARHAIDDGIVKGDNGTLLLVVVLFMVSALMLWGATYAQTYLVGWVGQRALQDLRIKLFSHLQKMSVGFYAKRKTGVLVSRLTNDVQALDQLVTDGIVTLFSATVTLIATVAILLFADLPLALASFSVIPVVIIASALFRMTSSSVYRLTRERIAAISSYLQETLSGIRVVRAYGQEPRHIARFEQLNEDNRETHMKTVHLNAAYFPSVELLSAIATGIILIYGGSRALDGEITVGVLVMFIGYLSNFFDPIQQLSQLYSTYQAGMAALDKIFDLLAVDPELTDQPGAKTLVPLRGDVSFQGVYFSYYKLDDPASEIDTANWALEDITIEIPAGQTLALVGQTGAGKSTFAKLIPRFHDPQLGRILIDGVALPGIQSNSLRTQLGYVPQEGFLFSGTVADNIAFGRPGATRDEIEAAAHSVGAHDALVGLPNGYDTAVGERGAMLSSGQRQLVAFSRAMLAEPRLLILDEATASVDVQTELRIENALQHLLSGRTSIVIAHRLSTIINADRIAVMEHGRLVELGSHDELLELNGNYAGLYTAWRQSAA